MKNYKNNYLNRRANFSFFFIILLFLGSCKKYVTVDLPNTKIVAQSVFSNNTSATSALTAIYSQMVNQYNSSPWALPCMIPLVTGLSGDELTNYATLSDPIQFYTNSIDPVSNGVIGSYMWTPAYSYIYQANAVMEGVALSAKINPKVKQQLMGEAKFIRAFHYFYLVNLFGDVPLALTTDYNTNAFLPRTAKALVYQEIVNDLTDAQNLLNNNYVSLTDTTSTTDRVRPNKSAAAALLARVYLYTGDWKNAEIQASSVIANSSMYSLTPISNVFLANSNEAIWQLMPSPNTGHDTPEGFEFILNAPPDPSGNNSNALSNQLLNAFEPGDMRRQSWVGSIIVGPNTYYFPFKYKVYTSATITEYSMVLRLAEQYLIRAESRAQQNNPSGAIADLNMIRNRAGLPNTTAITQSDILKAILHERQVELFTEWGHRWLDLKRTGNADAIMSTVTPLKGGTWQSYKQLYPIPFTEIQNDSKIVQNLGY